MAGNAQGSTEQWNACASQVENSCRDSSGLGKQYQHVTYDWPEAACMDMETIRQCGHPPIVVTATPIDDHAPPPINPPAGDVTGLEPGFGYPDNSDLTPEQERRQKLASCKSKANDELKICLDDAGRHRQIEFTKCEEANSIQHTFIRVGGFLIKRFGGKAKGLLPGYEELASYVGQNCKMNHDNDLLSDRDSCNHKKERETIICEAVYGN